MDYQQKSHGAGRLNRGFKKHSRHYYNTASSLEKIESALLAIPPDDRDEWLRAGMAIKSKLGENGFDLWDIWSQCGESYNAKDARAVWKSFRVGEIGIGTLYYIANQHGWRWKDKPPTLTPAIIAEIEQGRLEWEAKKAKERIADEIRQIKMAVEAVSYWNNYAPCESHSYHSYAEKKGISLDGLRIGDWPKWIKKGNRWLKTLIPGALIVPMVDIDGNIWNLQGIWAEPPKGFESSKLYLPGAKKSGLFHVIGKPTQTKLICEGLATGKTLYEQSGFQTFVAFDCGNLISVALTVRMRNPSAKIIMCADSDRHTPGNPGVTKAREAAIAVNGLVSVPEFPDGAEGTDFNDLHRLRMNGGRHA